MHVGGGGGYGCLHPFAELCGRTPPDVLRNRHAHRHDHHVGDIHSRDRCCRAVCLGHDDMVLLGVLAMPPNVGYGTVGGVIFQYHRPIALRMILWRCDRAQAAQLRQVLRQVYVRSAGIVLECFLLLLPLLGRSARRLFVYGFVGGVACSMRVVWGRPRCDGVGRARPGARRSCASVRCTCGDSSATSAHVGATCSDMECNLLCGGTCGEGAHHAPCKASPPPPPPPHGRAAGASPCVLYVLASGVLWVVTHSRAAPVRSRGFSVLLHVTMTAVDTYEYISDTWAAPRSIHSGEVMEPSRIARRRPLGGVLCIIAALLGRHQL